MLAFGDWAGTADNFLEAEEAAADNRRQIGSGTALIKGGELSDMATVGLGVEAQLSKTATFGLSDTGAYDGDVTMHGLRANLRFAF